MASYWAYDSVFKYLLHNVPQATSMSRSGETISVTRCIALHWSVIIAVGGNYDIQETKFEYHRMFDVYSFDNKPHLNKIGLL